MSTTQSNSVADAAVAANAATVRGLRDIADWLEQHPELPAMRGLLHATVRGASARAEMEVFARLLDMRVIEGNPYGDHVELRAERGIFPGCSVTLGAQASDLGAPVAVSYPPVLASCPTCRGTGSDPDADPDLADECPACGGARQILAGDALPAQPELVGHYSPEAGW